MVIIVWKGWGIGYKTIICNIELETLKCLLLWREGSSFYPSLGLWFWGYWCCTRGPCGPSAPVCYTFIRLPPFSKLLEFWMRILTSCLHWLSYFYKLCPLEILFFLIVVYCSWFNLNHFQSRSFILATNTKHTVLHPTSDLAVRLVMLLIQI